MTDKRMTPKMAALQKTIEEAHLNIKEAHKDMSPEDIQTYHEIMEKMTPEMLTLKLTLDEADKSVKKASDALSPEEMQTYHEILKEKYPHGTDDPHHVNHGCHGNH
ncbi:MAG: hypothetical protein PWQ51_2538 [Methanolobus sp.]|jgi:uncharacterized protein YggE|uniref:hypothetical protein n=1 Tax=unclassified Methanolobus TaxID=2629569 RepID=UPI003244E789|nr:hypothetical protein [Methanolobus sp.]